jgi:hypothetical protein
LAESIEVQRRLVDSWLSTKRSAEELLRTAKGQLDIAHAKTSIVFAESGLASSQAELDRLRGVLEAEEGSRTRLEKEIAALEIRRDELRKAADAKPAPKPDVADVDELFLPVEGFLGLWQVEGKERGYLITQQFPDGDMNEDFPNRLRLETNERIWEGEFERASRETGSPPVLTFKYKPDADEMNSIMPESVRKAVAGTLEWKIEITQMPGCGDPKLEVKFFPGEINWSQKANASGGLDISDARVIGPGDPRERVLVKGTAEAVELNTGTYLAVVPKGAPLVLGVMPASMLKHQLFHLYAFVPDEDATGNEKIVKVSGSGGDSTEIRLTKTHVRLGGNAVYRTPREISIADRNPYVDPNLDPSFLSTDWIVEAITGKQKGHRIPLSVDNEEVVTLALGEAEIRFRIYTTYIQRQLVHYKELIPELERALAHMRSQAGPTDGASMAHLRKTEGSEGIERRLDGNVADIRLHLLGNAEILFKSKRLSDPEKLGLLELYLHGVDGMVTGPRDAPIWKRWGEVDLIQEAYRPYPAGHPDINSARWKKSKLFGVRWTGEAEWKAVAARLKEVEGTRRAIARDTIYLAATYAAYNHVAGDFGAFYTIASGRDIFNKKKTGLDRLLTYVMWRTTKNAARTTAPYMREIRTNPRDVFTRPPPGLVAGRAPRAKLVDGKTLKQVAMAGTDKRITFEKFRQVLTGTPRRVPGEPVDITVRPARRGGDTLDDVRTFYADSKLEVVARPGKPQDFEMCNCNALGRAVSKATGEPAPSAMTMLGIMVREGIVKMPPNRTAADHPLVYGVHSDRVALLATRFGATTQMLIGKGRNGAPTLKQLSDRMSETQFVKTVISVKGEKHAVLIEEMVRTPDGKISDVQFYDPAFGAIVQMKACTFASKLFKVPGDSDMFPQIFVFSK